MQSIQYKYHNGEGSVSISKGSFDAGSNENFVTVSFDAMSIRNKLAKYYKIQIYADNIIVDEFIEQVFGNELYISKSFNLYKFFSENDWENMMFAAVVYPLLNNKLTTKMFFASPQTKFVCNIDAYLEAQENGEQKDVLCTVVNALTPVTYTWNVDGVITETDPIESFTNLLENIELGEEETQVSCQIVDGMGCKITKNLIFEAPEELDPDEGFYRQGAGIMLNKYPNVDANSYYVHVIDANGCIKSTPVLVLPADPEPIITALVTNQCTATEGNFEIDVALTTAGIAPYSYSIDGGAFQIRTVPFTISNLS